EALRAIPALRAAGVSVSHLHVSTLKPFTDPTIITALRSATAGVITMENHLTTGGLGSVVAEVMAENSIATPLHRMGLRDTYAHGASQPYLLAEYHLDALSLVRVAENVLDRPLGVSASDLTEVRVAATHSNAKVEAL
ncbi:MAG: transketolase C-terminal domain-containing protein, partial [Acidimicrobiales bacterium]|nr:transketolase C-terminal domain-containing protein [Acidimicrobiales bacterium]